MNKLKYLLAMLVLMCAACQQSNQQSSQPNNSLNVSAKRIGVTLLTKEHEFYRDLEAGLNDAAKQNNFQLTITSGDFDLAKQQSQIENFILQRMDAIIVCPADTKGIAPAIEAANAANIPVFTADIAASGGRVVSHIASDNLAGGRLAAEYIAKALNGQGSVGIIAQPEVQSTIDREQGFREALKQHAGIKIVSGLNGEGKRDRALKAAEDMLQAHADLKAIFAINDDSALGALSAAEARNRKDLIIVGYDATPEAVRAITSNTQLKADVAQQPQAIGRRTIEAVVTHFAGTKPAPVITVPVRIVDATNAATLDK